MATLPEFQTITEKWKHVDTQLKTLQPTDIAEIQRCLGDIESLEPVIQGIGSRNPQAGTPLSQANQDRRRRLQTLQEQYINQTETSLLQKCDQFSEFFQNITYEVSDLQEALAILDDIQPQINNLALLNENAAKKLGERILYHFHQLRDSPYRLKSVSEFPPSNSIHTEDINNVVSLFSEFDSLFYGLKSNFGPAGVDGAIELLGVILQNVNAIEKIDPGLGKELSRVYKEREEKLKIAIFVEDLIAIQTAFTQFDQIYPTIKPEVKAINNAIGLLNDASNRINALGPNYPRKGNELGQAFNVRMAAITAYGENVALPKKQ
jgi:hypothetical protein